MEFSPKKCLPIQDSWESTEHYVRSLLEFVTTSTLFRNLCGGVHVLDFLTRNPSIYSGVLPPEWREWFEEVDLYDVLDLLLREDLSQFPKRSERGASGLGDSVSRWRGYPLPPATLLAYIKTIRSLSLRRSFEPVSAHIDALPRHVAVGMKPKKIHEVQNFAAFIDHFSTTISASSHTPIASVVDFGSGQNYLGRTLVCPPYNKHVVAIEQHHHNVEGARGMDVHAKLAEKEKIMRNKKEYKRQLAEAKTNGTGISTPPREIVEHDCSKAPRTPRTQDFVQETLVEENAQEHAKGSITYIERELQDGRLESVLSSSFEGQTNNEETTTPKESSKSRSMVVSIHSCGNLTHHALRSLTLNPSIKAVAVVGCCYNLLTERLGPATYKLPQLRSNHPRLEATSSAYDPHGFPMSKRLEEFEYTVRTDSAPSHDVDTPPQKVGQVEKGVRLNITARMMAVQAPSNWGFEDSEAFFTRHFYRALLQRILLDLGVVQMATSTVEHDLEEAGSSFSGRDEVGSPLIIGTLRKSCFNSFPAYVSGALEKLYADPKDGVRIKRLTQCLVEDRDIIKRYERDFAYAKKNLSLIWSLMAFSAGVVESTIVVDRWLWLTEQPEVETAWVQSVFDYRQSPRNLVVIGIKKDSIDGG